MLITILERLSITNVFYVGTVTNRLSSSLVYLLIKLTKGINYYLCIIAIEITIYTILYIEFSCN